MPVKDGRYKAVLPKTAGFEVLTVYKIRKI